MSGATTAADATGPGPVVESPVVESPVVESPVVESLDAAVYVVPTDAPEADGTLAWDKTTLVLVTVRAGGQQGIGWSYTAAAAAAVVTGILSDVVSGWNALDVAGANEAMTRALRNVGRPGVGAMALSAADIALWDLKARLLGLPVASLLGRARDDVPVYGSGGFTTYDDTRTREQLSGWVDKDRIPRVKIKIGESWGATKRATWPGSRWPGRSSARIRSFTWTPTGVTPPGRRCGWRTGWTSSG